MLANYPGWLTVPALCLAEVAHLTGTRLGWESEVRLLAIFQAAEMGLEHVQGADFSRISELVARYRDLPLGTVDASIVAAAERLGVTEVATLDRRHFSVVRPRHVERFTLLP
ncbi:type II toxin-antitoxin system toxin ribonuclease C26 [soil metagenome]